jgi:hypothetical protein
MTSHARNAPTGAPISTCAVRVARSIAAIAVGAVCMMPIVASAHHSHANINPRDIQRHTGVVSEYGWSMPHVYLKVMAPNPRGDVVEYSIELLHPPGMLQRGWSGESFKAGDRITWEGPGDRDPNRYYSGLDWAEKGDGTRLAMDRDDSGVVPSSDFTGLWVRDLRGARPHYAPPTDWPYTERARTRVENFDESQNPQLDCIDAGPPKSTLLPYPIRISRPDDMRIVMDYELRAAPRVIGFDAAAEPGEPSKLGHSVAHFEGGELVIETANFIADPWGTHTGVDSSEQKHLVERFRLANGGLALEVQMTVTDPVYLTEPVTIDYYMLKMPERELISVPCTKESAHLFLEGGFQ